MQSKEAQLMPKNVRRVSGCDITGPRQNEENSKNNTFDKPVANNTRINKHPKISDNPVCMNKENIYHR